MRTDLTPIPSDPSGLTPAMPPMSVSWALQDALKEIRHPHPDILQPSSYPAAMQAEARSVISKLQRFASRVTEAALREWLAPVPLAVRNDKPPEALAGWVASVALAVGHLEAGGFTLETQRQALQTFKFFPSAADIYEIVAAPAVKIRDKMHGLRTIIEALIE